MNDEDLLITNNLNNSIKNLISKKQQSKYIYDKEKPDFLDDNSKNLSNNIDDNYLINQQLDILSSTDKKKKIKRTFINIDS